MALLRRLAALGAAAEAARRYAQKNPDKVRELAGKAAKFADQQTKGKYTGQIDSAVRKAAEVAGVGAPAPVSPIRPAGSPSSYTPPASTSSYTPPASTSPHTPPGSSTPDPSGPAAASGTPAPQRPTPFKRDE
jgi:hypothetical protein